MLQQVFFGSDQLRFDLAHLVAAQCAPTQLKDDDALSQDSQEFQNLVRIESQTRCRSQISEHCRRAPKPTSQTAVQHLRTELMTRQFPT